MTPSNQRPAARTLEAISWALLITVMAGGGSLLTLVTSGDLTPHEEQFFRAGHAHAGVLAAIGILYANALGRTALDPRRQVVTWLTYLVGVLLQSGGMFVHMLIGEAGERSAGTWITIAGGLVLAGSVLSLAWQLFANRGASTPHSGIEAPHA